MFLTYIFELVALSLLTRDAYVGRASHVSAQTCVGFTVSTMMGMFNLPRDLTMKLLKIGLVIAASSMGALCSYKVAKTVDNDGDDDLVIPGLPRRAYKFVPYAATAVASLLALLVACSFSVPGVIGLALSAPAKVICTLHNYMHAFALLPQLVLSNRRGFVAPAALRFLALIGVKHIWELFDDAYVSYQNYMAGRLSLDEFSFMSGDIFATLILLDFLYVIAMKTPSLVDVCVGEVELGLAEEGGAGGDAKATNTFADTMLGKAEQIWADKVKFRQFLGLVGVIGIIAAGFTMNLVSGFAVFGGGVSLAGVRLLQIGHCTLPKVQKKEQHCF